MFQEAMSVQKNGLPQNGHQSRKNSSEGVRVSRLLRIAQAIREDPHQPLKALQERLGIKKSQFYKDKGALAAVGFQFEYSKSRGFRITEDRLTPITGLSLSDRMVLMFALEQLSATGDGILAALAVEAGKKLAGGLPAPFREKLLSCFDAQVTSSFGVKPDILSLLRDAVANGWRIRILYTRSGTWEQRWRVVDPRHIYMRQRTLYLYARTVDESPPQWKVFRLNRIDQVQYSGITIQWRPEEDDGFLERQRNAFDAFIGDKAYPITVRFTGQARHYVQERQWHPSQVLKEDGKGGLLFTVRVAEPQEVVRWARQFGNEARVVENSSDDEPQEKDEA